MRSVAKATARVVHILGIVTVLASPVWPQQAEGARSDFEAAIFAGVFDTDASNPSIEAGLEVRRLSYWRGLGFMAGLTATDESSVWVYAGARYDLTDRSAWTIAPGFAVSLYEQGDGKDLGQPLEFRSSIEVGRRVSEELRVGLIFYHLSNASMKEVNPGSNSLVLSFAFRPPRRSG